jgi:hypothetical protein
MEETTGTQTIEWLYRDHLQVNDEWSIRTAHGFRWWADRHAQQVEVIGEGNGTLSLASLVRVHDEIAGWINPMIGAAARRGARRRRRDPRGRVDRCARTRRPGRGSAEMDSALSSLGVAASARSGADVNGELSVPEPSNDAPWSGDFDRDPSFDRWWGLATNEYYQSQLYLQLPRAWTGSQGQLPGLRQALGDEDDDLAPWWALFGLRADRMR